MAEETELEASWLAGPDACQAHLVYVAAEIPSVALSADDVHIQGRFGVPTSAGMVPFIPEAAYEGHVFPIRQRSRVRLDYQGRGVTYSFRTRTLKRDADGRFLLELPRVISRSDRRLVFRYQTHGDPAIRLVGEGRWSPPGPRELRLHDVSTDGVGFVLSTREPSLERGSLLSAELELPTTGTVVSLLRVAAVRTGNTEPGWIVGARYLDMSLPDRMNVGLALSIWAQRKSGR